MTSVAQASKPKAKPANKIISATDPTWLANFEPIASDETIEEAEKRIEAGLHSLGITTELASHMMFAVNYFVPSSFIETIAVVASSDARVVVPFNAEFIANLADPVTRNVKLALMHETYHLVLKHFETLSPDDIDPDLHDLAVTAKEIVVNHMVLLHAGEVSTSTGSLEKNLGKGKLIFVNKTDPDTGQVTTEEIGIHPVRMYESYSRALKKEGMNPLTYKDFVSSEQACFAELCRMPRPPRSRNQKGCVHGTPGAGGSDGEDGTPQDSQTVNDRVTEAIGKVLEKALNGDSRARQELMDLAEQVGDDALQAGGIDLGALRGQSSKTKTVSWWESKVRSLIASVLTPGSGLIYPVRLATIRRAMGFNTPLLHRGPERQHKLLVAFDLSGSVPQSVVEKMQSLVGRVRNCEIVWTTFDHSLYLHKPGEAMRGGGGTSFDPIMDLAEGRLTLDGVRGGDFDGVLVVTDGYAAEITPKQPGKWIWVLTPGASDWPAHPAAGKPMPVIRLTEDDIASIR